MPTYEYRCESCGEVIEAVQSFSDPALTDCPNCGEAKLRKLFGNVGVVFKGSGFYRTDSRSEGRKSIAAPTGKKTEAVAKKPDAKAIEPTTPKPAVTSKATSGS